MILLKRVKKESRARDLKRCRFLLTVKSKKSGMLFEWHVTHAEIKKMFRAAKLY